MVAAHNLVEVFDPAELPLVFRTVTAIRECGRVQRLRNPDLWDALLLPILQHRGRAADGARLYRRLCSEYGEKIRTERSAVQLPPRPQTVVGLDDAALERIGLRLSMAHRLRSIANDYLTYADAWLRLPPHDLFLALQEVKHVGEWTAATATADLTNDFSFYPRTNFATPARWEQFALESGGAWTPYDFAMTWEYMDRGQKSTLTALSCDWKARHPHRRDEAAVTGPPISRNLEVPHAARTAREMTQMTNDTVSSGFAAAEAAYTTWQQEVKVHAEPLGTQEPDVQVRWLRIAEAARSAPPTDKHRDTGPAVSHTMTRFQAPLAAEEAAR